MNLRHGIIIGSVIGLSLWIWRWPAKLFIVELVDPPKNSHNAQLLLLAVVATIIALAVNRHADGPPPPNF